MITLQSSRFSRTASDLPTQDNGLWQVSGESPSMRFPPPTISTLAECRACPLTLTESIPGEQSLVLILSLAGELNCHSYTQLVEIARARYCQGWRALLLDMSQTSAIELSGLLALLNISLLYHHQAMLDPDDGWETLHGPMRSATGEFGRFVKLLAPSAPAIAALDRAPFTARLQHYADLESALVAFEKEKIEGGIECFELV